VKVGLGLLAYVLDWGVTIFSLVLTGFGGLGRRRYDVQERGVVSGWVRGFGGRVVFCRVLPLLTAEAGGVWAISEVEMGI
jgi:hypothetical protein